MLKRILHACHPSGIRGQAGRPLPRRICDHGSFCGDCSCNYVCAGAPNHAAATVLVQAARPDATMRNPPPLSCPVRLSSLSIRALGPTAAVLQPTVPPADLRLLIGVMQPRGRGRSQNSPKIRRGRAMPPPHRLLSRPVDSDVPAPCTLRVPADDARHEEKKNGCMHVIASLTATSAPRGKSAHRETVSAPCRSNTCDGRARFFFLAAPRHRLCRITRSRGVGAGFRRRHCRH